MKKKMKRARDRLAAPQAHERVLILDFGSQYTQLIARRVRECGAYSEIVPHTISPADLAANRPAAIILSGGPASVTETGSPTCEPGLLRLGIPVLGICYGLQLMAKLLGGRVLAAERREYGHAVLQVLKRQDLFVGLGPRLQVWMSHGDQVAEVPEGFEIIARTPTAPVAAMANARKRLYGLQFHPEVVHTPKGLKILRNFLFRAAKCRGGWTAQSFVATAVEQVRQTVGDGRVLCATSGGVDSSVLAALLHRAIGERLECVFINNGLLRKNEAANVRRKFRDHLGIHVHCLDASRQFLKRLRNVAGPERKRRIIGNVFIRVFEREARRLGSPAFLAQGTLYPDVIESRSARGGPSATIKTHHNVGGLPTNLRFKLIEPFRYLFKDEVRRVGARGADRRAGQSAETQDPARGRRHFPRGTAPRGGIQEDLAGAGGAPAGQGGGRHGRRADLRERHRAARRHEPGRHDRRLGQAAAHGAGADRDADHQRSQGCEPRRVRHEFQAAQHD